MSSLLCKSAVKKFLLEYAGRRHHKFTRVSQEALDYVEMKVREACRLRVDSLPSKGKTI